MKAVFHVSHLDHQQVHGMAMKEGLERHGIQVEFGIFNQYREADFNVVWGWRQSNIINNSENILVMERGHVGDRFKYTSCGWNGLGNRGIYPKAMDGGQRWKLLFSHLMRDWKGFGDYILLIGQVEGDASLYGLKGGFLQWTQEQTNIIRNELGERVLFRPHPLVKRLGFPLNCPHGAELSESSLEKDLSRAKFCVVYNSTTSVESVLYGVPTITLDEGAMAWDVTAHNFYDEPGSFKPDRTKWAHDLAWTQWTLEEIRSGEVWEHLRELCHAPPQMDLYRD